MTAIYHDGGNQFTIRDCDDLAPFVFRAEDGTSISGHTLMEIKQAAGSMGCCGKEFTSSDGTRVTSYYSEGGVTIFPDGRRERW